MTDRELYKTLGVNADATPDEIKQGYRRNAARTHPDVGGDAESFRKVQTAFLVLSNAKRRAHYDATGDADGLEADNVQANIHSAIAQVLTNVLEQDFPLEQLSLRDVAAEIFRTRLNELKSKRDAHQRQQFKYEKAARRFTRRKKAGPNIMRTIAQGLADQEKRHCVEVGAMIEMIEASLTLLAEHDYEVDLNAGIFTARYT